MTRDEAFEQKDKISDAVQEHVAINMAALGFWVHKTLVAELQLDESVQVSASCPVSDETLPDKTEVYIFFSTSVAHKTAIVRNFCVGSAPSCPARALERCKVLGTVYRPPLAGLISVRAPWE